MKRKPERISGVVRSVLERLDKRSNPTSDEINKIWQEVVGKKAFTHTKPASLKEKKLVINVDGSGWLYELTLKKKQLLNKMKSKLGQDKVKELQFRIGEL